RTVHTEQATVHRLGARTLSSVVVFGSTLTVRHRAPFSPHPPRMISRESATSGLRHHPRVPGTSYPAPVTTGLNRGSRSRLPGLPNRREGDAAEVGGKDGFQGGGRIEDRLLEHQGVRERDQFLDPFVRTGKTCSGEERRSHLSGYVVDFGLSR